MGIHIFRTLCYLVRKRGFHMPAECAVRYTHSGCGRDGILELFTRYTRFTFIIRFTSRQVDDVNWYLVDYIVNSNRVGGRIRIIEQRFDKAVGVIRSKDVKALSHEVGVIQGWRLQG